MREPLETAATEWYTHEVRTLPRPDRDKIDQKLAYLREKGWTRSVADRSVKHLRDGIYELRVLGRGAAYRLLFFVIQGRSPRVVVLVACVAKSVMKKQARLDAEVDRALVRRALWTEQQKARGDDEG